MGIYQDDDEPAPMRDSFADALALCQIAANPRNIAAAVKKLAKLNREIADAEQKLASLNTQAAGIVDATRAEAAQTRKLAEEETRELRDDLAMREQMMADRERRIYRLENAWRNIGEPGEVYSGFRSPTETLLAKARATYGLPPIDERRMHDEIPEGQITQRQLEAMDSGFVAADESGQVEVPMPVGSTSKLTRSFPNKMRAAQ